MFSDAIFGLFTGKVRSTPTPKLTLRTVKVDMDLWNVLTDLLTLNCANVIHCDFLISRGAAAQAFDT